MEDDRRLDRIATLSRRLRWTIRIIMGLALVGLLVVFSAILVGGGETVAMTVSGGMEIGLDAVSAGGRLLLMASILPALGIMLAIVYHTDRLLDLYQRGRVFGREHAHRIRWSGQLMIALAIVDALTRPLIFLLARQLGAGVHDATFDVNLGLLFAGAFVVLIGHVMGVGADLAEEQSLTI